MIGKIDWLIEQCFTSPPTQYKLYGRRFFYRSKDPINSIKVLKERMIGESETRDVITIQYERRFNVDYLPEFYTIPYSFNNVVDMRNVQQIDIEIEIKWVNVKHN